MIGRIGSREWWIVGLALTALALFLAYDGTLRRADAAFYDLISRIDRRAPDPAILLVTIDDRSLSETGPWPWPRERHADLIAHIRQAGGQLVGYDVLFLEPQPGDAALAAAMRGGMPVFLPFAVERPGPNGADHAVRNPVPDLAAAAAGLGHVGIASDADGPVRHGWLWDGGPSEGMPHMAVQMARHLGAPISRGDDDPVLIPFTGPSGHYPAISAGSILRGEVPPELLRGRIILIGATAPGLGDQHPVALGRGGTMAGVELLANMLDGILHQRLIREGGKWAALCLAVPAIWLLLLALRLLTPRRSPVALVGLLLALLGISVMALLWLRIWLPPATALASLLLVYPLWSWRRLAATHAYMTDELARLRQEPDLLAPQSVSAATADPVTRQIASLREAIERLRTLRRIEAQREELLRFLTHDMRSPQASILACLSTAGEGEIAPGLVARIGGYARRTLDLSDGFVRLARAEAQNYSLTPQNLADIMIDAADDLWPQARAANVTIRTSGDEEEVIVSCDRALLTRALINLLGNALKFSASGGEVRITVDMIDMDGRTMAHCAVEDDGPGVPPDRVATLFTRFSVGNGVDGEGEGIGLGLAFVDAVVRGHGGRVWYDAPPTGARFRLIMALAPEGR